MEASTNAGFATATRVAATGVRARLACAVFGHHVDNRRIEDAATIRCRACGEGIRDENGALTHIRHVLSCFLGHHTYVRRAARADHHEYMCVDCGHPLLFRGAVDPYDPRRPFFKRVRYLCGILGHAVHEVGPRAGLVEYACGCGHSFLRARSGAARIFHPLSCVFRGHFVSFVGRRDGFAEFRCAVCGHPFGFGAAA